MNRALLAAALALACGPTRADESALTRHWIWSTAHKIPDATTSEQSGYFSIVEGLNNRIYIGTAKYGENAFLVEFDPATKAMKVVLDAHKEIGTTAKGFAAQSKFHTRNNVGKSGKIYLGTKQGYPKDGEKRSDYPGGYPMVFDPKTGTTRVYPIPIPQQGIISVTPDEDRGLAYISTCSDGRPIESTHFLILDLKTGTYRDLLDCRHMYAFIVVDYLGRAYHPILGGEIARYDPRTDKLERLKQTIDGKPPEPKSHLVDEHAHPINWELSPDKKTLYAVAMSGNQLFAYDLTAAGDTIPGRRLGPLCPAASATDCRAMAVAPDGTVWAGVAATFDKRGQLLHVVSFTPGNRAPTDHGPLAIGNPDYTAFNGPDGKPKPWHHGAYHLKDDTLLPRYSVMGICPARDGTVYLTTLAPFTLHVVRIPRIAGVTTVYYHNSHADVLIGRLMQTDSLDNQGQTPPLKLTSLTIDQFPTNDIGRDLAATRRVPTRSTIAEAVAGADGVLLIAEHGNYPKSDTGQIVYPKRRMFEEVVKEMDRAGRSVPVFVDKHLADNWTDAKRIYDTARAKKIPLMAGSSVPGTWRDPPADVKRDAKLIQIVAVSYHTLDAYGFHALETVQALAERRSGGETGVARVRCLTGPAVWAAANDGTYDRKLLDAALARLKYRPIPANKKIEDLVPEPILFVIDYTDGLRTNVFTLNHAVAEWAAAWQYNDNTTESTLFYTQEARPFGHFTIQLMNINKMFHTHTPTYPPERTLLTSGILDACLISKKQSNKPIETPHLNLKYTSNWNWQQPPPPPKNRPIQGQ